MSLDHAILGFLSYGPLSGYDLKERFDLSVAHFWPADQSQIYRTLARLEEQGYAKSRVQKQTARPDRKVYTLTPTGRKELGRWLTTPLGAEIGRSAALIQVFFSGSLSDEEIAACFRRQAAQGRAALSTLRGIQPRAEALKKKVGTARDAWCWFLTLECGFRLVEAKVAWMEEVVERIEKGEAPKAAPRKAKP